MHEGIGAKKPWYVGVLGAAAIAVAVKLATPVVAGALGGAQDKGAVFDQQVVNHPVVSLMMQPFAANFPEEFGAFRAKIIAGLDEGKTPEQMRVVGYNYMQGFAKAHTKDLVQAPSATLSGYWDQQGVLMKQMRSDSVSICGHFAMKGIAPEDRPSESLMKAISAFAGQRIVATKEGMRSPVGRSITPTDDDYVALFAAMKKLGLTDDQSQILSTSSLDKASVDQQCTIGILINDAVSAMHNAQGDRLRAGLLSESGS